MKNLLVICTSVSSYGVLNQLNKIVVGSGGYKITVVCFRLTDSEKQFISERSDSQVVFRDSEDFISDEPILQPLLRKHADPRNCIKLYKEALQFTRTNNTRKVVQNKATSSVLKNIAGVFKRGKFEQSTIWPKHTAFALKVARMCVCIEQLRPDVIVSTADGVSSQMELLTVAREKRVPVVVVPYGFPLMVDMDISMQQKKVAGKLITTEREYGFLVEKYCPQWIKQGIGSGALMFTPEHIVILESLGVNLARPWSVTGNLGSCLCVEGEINKRHYLAEGVPVEKLKMTGSPYCDIVRESAHSNEFSRSAFLHARKISDSKTKILVSWPTSYHNKYVDQSEFDSYEEMTTTCFSILANLSKCEITVSCHPAMSDKEKAIIRSLDITLSDSYLLELIPQNDIFMSFFSSTNRWALAAGKIVVNYDMYNLDLDIYDSAPGFYRSGKIDELKKIFDKLVEENGELEDLMSRQIENAGVWGEMDGACSQRILEEIDRARG